MTRNLFISKIKLPEVVEALAKKTKINPFKI